MSDLWVSVPFHTNFQQFLTMFCIGEKKKKKKVLFYKMSDTNLHGLNYLIGNSRPIVQHAITEMPRLFEKKLA